MLLKIVVIFLLAMVLVGMIGKLVFPSALDQMKRRARLKPRVCTRCGRHVIGSGCDCGKKG